MTHLHHIIICIVFSCICIMGCNGDNDSKTISAEEIYKENIAEIKNYISKNNLTATEGENGLHYIITQTGDNIKPTINSDVEVKYIGQLTNGTVFDKTQGDNTVTFALSRLITGWQLALPKIGQGGKIKILLPAQLGYGSSPVGNIPANSVLIFDMELIKVKN